jgi:hypothetical protein
MTAYGGRSIAWLLQLVVAAIPACESRRSAPLKPSSVAPILLFAGAGTSSEDVAAVETILDESHLDYSLVSTSQMNGMTEPQLRSYRLLIVPGGNFETIGRNLTPSAIANVHDAVQNGLGYLGLCAGAFLAGRSTHYASFDLADVQFGFYAEINRGVRKAAVPIAGPGTPTLQQYWEDGPQLGGWGAAHRGAAERACHTRVLRPRTPCSRTGRPAHPRRHPDGSRGGRGRSLRRAVAGPSAPAVISVADLFQGRRIELSMPQELVLGPRMA